MSLARREFLLGSLAFPALPAQKKAPAPPPNILPIVAGDLGTWMLGCDGNQDIHTPNIDLLAKEGTRFGSNFVCAPQSAPSRATLFTGRVQGLQSKTTLFDTLTAQGYNCGYAGAWQSGDRPLDSVTGKAHQFLDQQSKDRPFLLTVSYAEPHPPYEGRARQYDEMYAKTTFETMGREPASPNATTDKDLLKDIVGSLRKSAAAISALDAQIPLLLSKLHDRGLRENTLIVFCSANGALLGRHGLWGDGSSSDPVNMYEEVVRVPMIWNWPGRVPVESVRNELVSFYDVVPSLCEVAGVTPPAGSIGRSYATLAYGKRLPKKQPWRTAVFGQFRNTQMARNSRYKLILRDQGKGPNELYDLAVDPRERVNRYDNPAHLSIREQLTHQIAMFQKT
jgi:arylsulfatase A-like enzyme